MRGLGVALLVSLLAACGAGANRGPESGPSPSASESAKTPPPLLRAYFGCGSGVSDGYTFRDHMTHDGAGTSITFARNGGSDQSEVDALQCVLDRVAAPISTMDLVTDTTALMGRQADSWDSYTLLWSYHPESGLDAVLRHAP